MKKKLFSLLVVALLLTGCGKTQQAPGGEAGPEVSVTAEIVQPTPEPTPSPTPCPTPTPTPAPEHSPLYIEGLSVEDVISYFNEVCLDAEFVNSGDPSCIQKWTVPITYIIEGDATEQDLEMLKGFEDWLNTIEGFPGILGTDDPLRANLQIYFCSQPDMVDIMGDDFYGLDGGVTFWYDNNEIYRAVICYRNDIDQTVRNSVILEEIYNGLGPIQDTQLRLDSIIYAGFSAPQELTEVDELLLRLLYHPDIRCGMYSRHCEEIIRSLYY